MKFSRWQKLAIIFGASLAMSMSIGASVAYAAATGPTLGINLGQVLSTANGELTAVSNTLAVDLGLDDESVAAVNLWTTIAAAAGCIAGGWLSDRFGRRRMLALFIGSMAPAVLWLAWSLQQAGWVGPVATGTVHAAAPAFLVTAFWVSSLAFSLGNGLMYAARGALFMDVTNPRVAATQFTAYMAMNNLVIAYSAKWQGLAVERFGYPATLGIDVDAAANVILRNMCSGNTTNWSIVANNVVGPIIDRRAPASAAISGNSAPDSTGSTHPNANFTY